MLKLNLNKFRVNLDKAIDYIPLASVVNNAIDLIQKRVFEHSSKLSPYHKHIQVKTVKDCLINMIPFAKLINHIRNRHIEEVDIRNRHTEEVDIATVKKNYKVDGIVINNEVVEIDHLTMSEIVEFATKEDEEGFTLLDDYYNLKEILPFLLDKLSTEDLIQLFSTNRKNQRTIWNNIDQEMIDSLSKLHCIRFTALLASAQEFSSSIIQLLPPYAQDYQRILADFTLSKPSPVSRIYNTRDFNHIEKLAAIAHWIEVRKIALSDIKPPYKRFFDELAPHIRYANFIGFNDTAKANLLLKNCTNLNTLTFNDGRILNGIDGLPHLQTLDCDDTQFIEALNVKVPQLVELYCYNTQLTALPNELPLLKVLDCSNTRLTALPNELPLLELLDCSNTRLTALPNELPRLKELGCSDTPLTALPNELPLLEKLYCGNTPLTALPNELPLLEKLYCCKTPLTALPNELPLLEKLYCSDTPLATLPNELPLLKVLNCSDTPLATLPNELPLLKFLDCSNTPLATLPNELPLLKFLDCSDTPLTALPNELPLLEELDCKNCLLLVTLPFALPNCERLDYSFCPNIEEIPEVPFDTIVICEDATAFNSLEVDFERFLNEPREFLQLLGIFLLNNQPFPNVIYFENDEPSEAVDAGGVRRDFMTRLCENLFKLDVAEELQGKFLKIAQDAKPIALDNEGEIEAYKTLGVILAICYGEHSNFKTGPRFSEEVYQCLLAPYEPSSEAWFMHNSLQSKISQEVIAYLIALETPQPQFSDGDLENLSYLIETEDSAELTSEYVKEHIESIRNELLEQAKSDQSLQAISWMAETMKNKLRNDRWNALLLQTSAQIKDRIEGVLNVEALKAKLVWDFSPNITQANRTKTEAFLNTWIDNNSEYERLSLFVRAITGVRTLPAENLKIEVVNRGKNIPEAHTCFFSLDLSAELDSQDEFNEKLEILLEHTKAGTGFSAI